MRALHDVAHLVGGRAGHAGRDQPVQQLLGGTLGKVLLDHRLQDSAVGDPALVGGEALVGQPVGPLERGAEDAPERIVGAGDEDRERPGREDAQGEDQRVSRSHAHRVLTREPVVGDPMAHHVHADIEQREVEALAAAGLVPAEQGEGDAGGAERAGAVVDRRRADPAHLAVLRSGGLDQSDFRLDAGIVAGARRVGAGLAVSRDRGIDQPRIFLRHDVPAEAQLVDDARHEGFHEDVGLGDQPHQHVAAARGAQVEGEAALVAVHRRHPGAAEMRAEVLAVEGLDLDHVGAHVAQDLAGGRTGDDLREVEDERVGERKHFRMTILAGEASTHSLTGAIRPASA